MENASKAILIAGGMLLGVVLLGLMVYLFRAGAGLGQAYDSKSEQEEILSFNSEVEKYVISEEILPQDIVSLANFVYNNNRKNEFNTSVSIAVEVRAESGKIYKILPTDTLKSNCFLDNSNNNFSFAEFLKKYTEKVESTDEYGRTIMVDKYKIELVSMNYNKTTGRINKIVYKISET